MLIYSTWLLSTYHTLHSLLFADGRTFGLHRPASSSCLIPLDLAQHFVVVGGYDAGAAVAFVDRWVLAQGLDVQRGQQVARQYCILLNVGGPNVLFQCTKHADWKVWILFLLLFLLYTITVSVPGIQAQGIFWKNCPNWMKHDWAWPAQALKIRTEKS